MKRPVRVESASALIDEKIKELGDWRGKTLATWEEKGRVPFFANHASRTSDADASARRWRGLPT